MTKYEQHIDGTCAGEGCWAAMPDNKLCLNCYRQSDAYAISMGWRGLRVDTPKGPLGVKQLAQRRDAKAYAKLVDRDSRRGGFRQHMGHAR